MSSCGSSTGYQTSMCKEFVFFALDKDTLPDVWQADVTDFPFEITQRVFASPIFDHKGNVLGVIDASSDARSREQHTLALVKLASRSVETRIFVEQFKSNMIIGFHPRKEYP